MAKPGKRSAEEAFEEAPPQDLRAEKKRKRKEDTRHRAETAKLANELEPARGSGVAQQVDELAFAAHDGPAQLEVRPHLVSHGGKSKRKRNREWKEKHAQTTPKKEVNLSAQSVKEAVQAETISPIPNAEVSEKRKKRRQRKKHKTAKTEDTLNLPVVEEEERDGASEDGGAHLQENSAIIPTLGTHSVEPAREAKRRERSDRQRDQRQLHSQLQAGNGESFESEDESMLEQVKTGDLAEESPYPGADVAEESTGLPLEDRIESPTSSRKRKRRYRKGRQSVIIKRQASGGEDLEDESAMQVDEDAPEVTSAPLEDRIEIPDEMRSRQQEVAKVTGDASSADGSGDYRVEVNNQATFAVALPEKKRMHRRPSHQADLRREGPRNKSWSVSEGSGGVFIDQDPILSPDDQYLILPTRSEVRVYSRSTSLLVRSLRSEESGHIVSCVLSKSDPLLLLVGTSHGIISLWNWTDGNLIDAWSTIDGLRQIVPFALNNSLSIVAVHYNDKRYHLKMFHLHAGTDELEEVTILQNQKHLGTTQFFQESGIIVTYARNQIIIGHCRNFDTSRINEESFTWHRLKLPSNVASFDAQVGQPVGKRLLARIDLAVGLERGDILTYEDILFKMNGKSKDPSSSIEPRILTWHRNAVNAVKWTRDSNYLISGGSETTLVFWQLDTNSKEFLPHLSNPILNLTVSGKGSAYALRLADNSVMILGTANREPETSVSGLAVSNTGRLVAALHPASSDRLLVACPTDTLAPLSTEEHNTSLQTYDLSADFQLGRQALTRNVTTIVNIDPEGRPLREPNVGHLQISADGMWLATIDEWQPPTYDLDATYLPEERDARRENSEIRLRIWSHNDDQGYWELVTRVDDPNSIARILSFQNNPARAEFAAVGADGIIRVWQPRARVRDGIRVLDAQGNQLFTWMSTHAVNVPMYGEDEAQSAAMAYSDDGSILAVSLQLGKKALPWTHLIDVQSGVLVDSVPGLFTDGGQCIAFAGRSLVLLSKMICVYDVVNSQVVSKLELTKKYLDPGSSMFLAVNRLDNTIAIGLNRKGKHGGRLTVLDVKKLDKGPLLEEKIPGQIRLVLASPSTSGFVVIDGYSQIRQVRPPGHSRALVRGAAGEPEEVTKGLDRVFGKGQGVNGADIAAGMKMLTGGEADRDQISSRTLEEVLGLDTSASAPGVEDLFEKIAAVFARPVSA